MAPSINIKKIRPWRIAQRDSSVVHPALGKQGISNLALEKKQCDVNNSGDHGMPTVGCI